MQEQMTTGTEQDPEITQLDTIIAKVDQMIASKSLDPQNLEDLKMDLEDFKSLMNGEVENNNQTETPSEGMSGMISKMQNGGE